MKKKGKWMLLIGLCWWQNVYTATTINFTKQLVVIYKVLDPLSVIVDKPEKMTVSVGDQTFKYSEVSTSKSPLNIKIETPYNDRDEILDKIYGTAALKLANNGDFNLVNSTTNTEIIKGRGFFKDGSSSLILPLYNASTPNKYQASTTVDAIFNEERKQMLMGNYKGVLILNVTYGG